MVTTYLLKANFYWITPNTSLSSEYKLTLESKELFVAPPRDLDGLYGLVTIIMKLCTGKFMFWPRARQNENMLGLSR